MEDYLKILLSKVPGFRTNVKWKKWISALIIYPFILFMFIVYSEFNSEYAATKKDSILLNIQNTITLLLLIGVPFILITNIGKIRSKLPLFKSRKAIHKLLASVLTAVFLLLMLAVTDSAFSSSYSKEFTEKNELQSAKDKKEKLVKKEQELKDKQQVEQNKLATQKREEERKKQEQLAQEKKDKLKKEKQALAAKKAKEQKAKEQAEKAKKEKLALEKKEKEKQRLAEAAKQKENAEAEKETASSNTEDSKNSLDHAFEFVSDSINNFTDSKNSYVLGVKNATRNGKTYDGAFNEFFGSPKWNYFQADTGQHIVEFTGNCMYSDTKVKAKIQFIYSDDKQTFEVGYLGFNDIRQNMLITGGLLGKVFGDLE